MLGMILSRQRVRISQAITILCCLQRAEPSLVFNGVVGISPVNPFPSDGSSQLSFTMKDFLLFTARDLLFHHCFRSIGHGIPCSLYIYDRHSSQLRVARDSGIHRLGLDERQFNLARAHMAALLGCYTLVNLGFLSLQKSTLIPSQSGNTIRYDYLLMRRPLRGLAFSNPDEIPVVAADCLPNNFFSCDIAIYIYCDILLLIRSQPLKIALPMHVIMSLLTVPPWSMCGINRASDPTISPLRFIKPIFSVPLATNSTLKLFHIHSAANLADAASRFLSPDNLASAGDTWSQFQAAFCGDSCHTVDLMVLPSNVMLDSSEKPLPFFWACR